jgi:hypothetical protein
VCLLDSMPILLSTDYLHETEQAIPTSMYIGTNLSMCSVLSLCLDQLGSLKGMELSLKDMFVTKSRKGETKEGGGKEAGTERHTQATEPT